MNKKKIFTFTTLLFIVVFSIILAIASCVEYDITYRTPYASYKITGLVGTMPDPPVTPSPIPGVTPTATPTPDPLATAVPTPTPVPVSGIQVELYNPDGLLLDTTISGADGKYEIVYFHPAWYYETLKIEAVDISDATNDKFNTAGPYTLTFKKSQFKDGDGDYIGHVDRIVDFILTKTK